MGYFLKVYGNSDGIKATKNFNSMGIEEEAAYYFLKSKIFFGKYKPKEYKIGDIFIQYAPLSLKSEFAGRILGVYESTSCFKQGKIIEIDTKTKKPKIFETYVDVKNLNLHFSERSKEEDLLNMRDEKDIIDFPSGNIASGWAYLDEKDARNLINKIYSFKRKEIIHDL